LATAGGEIARKREESKGGFGFILPNIAFFIQSMDSRIKPISSYHRGSSNLDELVKSINFILLRIFDWDRIS